MHEKPFEKPAEKSELAKNNGINTQDDKIGRSDGQEVNHHPDPGWGVNANSQQCIKRGFNEEC
jgi:hypothetical protein